MICGKKQFCSWYNPRRPLTKIRHCLWQEIGLFESGKGDSYLVPCSSLSCLIPTIGGVLIANNFLWLLK
jgi:hypothetical protein